LIVQADLTVWITFLSRYARDLRTDFGPCQSWELQSHYWTLHSRAKSCFSSVRFSADIFNCGRGDIRVVKAVECDDLLHLVLFPVNTISSVARCCRSPCQRWSGSCKVVFVTARLRGSQCSGGDLDGDDYTVIWAEVLPSPAYFWFWRIWFQKISTKLRWTILPERTPLPPGRLSNCS
jgi:hypothetical protein